MNIELLDSIFDEELIVYEDVQGDKIYLKWEGEDFIIKADNLNSNPINFIDNSIDNYYGKALEHFNSLDNRIKSLLPKKWWFCFEYFPEDNDIYSRKPLNNLVLSSIIKNGNEHNYSVEEIEEFSRLMNVECLPFIFKGKLSEKSIEAIKYFLNTSPDDLEYVFGENNFAFFLYKILNPQTSQSFLMNHKFNDSIKKIVLKINNTDSKFEILNPLYDKISGENKTLFLETYSLCLISFLNWVQSIDFEKFKFSGNKKDEVYTNMICKLFNLYVADSKNDLLRWDFIIPEFFNKNKFTFNKELVLNKLTKQHITDKKLAYIFKCIYFSFNNEIEKKIGLFTDGMLKLFNNYVKEINRIIDDYFGKKSEEELLNRGMLNAAEFFDIVYDKDAENKVYPSVLDEIEKGENKKKKGVFGKNNLGK